MLGRGTFIAASVLLISGCASVVTDKTQPVKVETLDQAGNAIVGTKCELQNDRGAFNVETPNTVFVRKSSGDLVITCKAPDQPQADAKLISRTGAAVFGNIILGGVIGAVVDTASGVAYNYPEWVQLVFGRTLTFDRNDHKDAQPTVALSDSEAAANSVAQNDAPASTDASVSAPQEPQPQKVEYITIVAGTEDQSPNAGNTNSQEKQ